MIAALLLAASCGQFQPQTSFAPFNFPPGGFGPRFGTTQTFQGEFPSDSHVLAHWIAGPKPGGVNLAGQGFAVTGTPSEAPSTQCVYSGEWQASLSDANYLSMDAGSNLGVGGNCGFGISFTPTSSSAVQVLFNDGVFGGGGSGFELDLNNTVNSIPLGHVVFITLGAGSTFQPIDLGAYVPNKINIVVIGRSGTSLEGSLNGGPWQFQSGAQTAAPTTLNFYLGRGQNTGSAFLGTINEFYATSTAPPAALAYLPGNFNSCPGIGQPALWLNSANADGSNDGSLTNGQQLATLTHNTGGTSLTQTNGALYQGMFLGGPFADGLGAINFNGMYTSYGLANSAAWDTTVFDFFMLYRTVQPSKHFLFDSFGSGAGTNGVGIEMGDDGHTFVGIESGGSFLATLSTTTPAAAETYGPWQWLECRHDGYLLQCSRDFTTYEGVSTGPSILAGSSSFNWTIGASQNPISSLPISPSNLDPGWLQGDVLDIEMFPYIVTPAQRYAIMAAYARRGPKSDHPALAMQLGDSTDALGGQGGAGDAITTITRATMYERDHGPGLLVGNQAIPNTTSSQELTWWTSNIQPLVKKLSIIFEGGGINDLGASIPPLTTQANLKHIENDALDAGCRVIYETWNPISSAPTFDAGFFQPTIDLQRAWMLAEANGTTIWTADNYFVLGDGGTEGYPAYMAADQVHETGPGNVVIKANIARICADAGFPCN